MKEGDFFLKTFFSIKILTTDKTNDMLEIRSILFSYFLLKKETQTL